MVFQALSDLYFGSVHYANRNIRRTLANMELHTCNNLSSMKKVVYGHLHLKRPFWGFSCIFIEQNIMTAPLFFSCPSTQSADMEKAETSV